MSHRFFIVILILTLLGCSRAPAPTGTTPASGVQSTRTATSTPVQEPSRTPLPSATPLPSQTPTATIPPTPYRPFAGIHIPKLNDVSELELAQAAGIAWSRFDDFHWEEIEPERSNPPAYDWEMVDETGLLNLVKRGIEPIGIILDTPLWAQKFPGVACGPVAETALDAFAQFAAALVSRYAQPPYNVRYWEIGNEPDIAVGLVAPDWGFGCWGDNADAYYGGGYYARMLEVVAPAMKSANPDAQVLVGGLNLFCDPVNPPETSPGSGEYRDCKPSRFLEGILANGGGVYLDGISFHTYDYYTGKNNYMNDLWHSSSATTGPVMTAKAQYLRSLLSVYGMTDTPLFNTEVSLLCGSEGNEPLCLTEAFLNTKAAYAAQVNAAAVANGVTATIWYSLTGWRASGLVDRFLNPLDAHRAFTFSTAQLQGVVFSRVVDEIPGVTGYEFTRATKRFWVVWSLDGAQHSLSLPQAPSAVLDLYGAPLPLEAQVPVGLQPVYIEWDAP